MQNIERCDGFSFFKESQLKTMRTKNGTWADWSVQWGLKVTPSAPVDMFWILTREIMGLMNSSTQADSPCEKYLKDNSLSKNLEILLD